MFGISYFVPGIEGYIQHSALYLLPKQMFYMYALYSAHHIASGMLTVTVNLMQAVIYNMIICFVSKKRNHLGN